MSKCEVSTLEPKLIMGGEIMKKVSDRIEKQVCKDYCEGKYSSRELGEKYSISKTTVLRILKRNNIQSVNRRLVNNNLKVDYFKNIDSEEKAYFLGFIFADGSVSNNELFIDINEKDIDILIKFKEEISSQSKISTRLKGKSSMSRIAIKNKVFVDNLSKYGIIENKTKYTKHLPYELIPKHLWNHFLRGLIDGDGWVIKTREERYAIGYVTQYRSTASDFVYMMNELIEDKWNNKIIDRNKKYSVVQIQKFNQVKQLATALYVNSNIHLSRKFHMAQEILDSKS